MTDCWGDPDCPDCKAVARFLYCMFAVVVALCVAAVVLL